MKIPDFDGSWLEMAMKVPSSENATPLTAVAFVLANLSSRLAGSSKVQKTGVSVARSIPIATITT